MERTPKTIAEELERHEAQKQVPAPERIGHVLIDAAEKARSSTRQVKVEKNIDTMSRSELLELSSSIKLEASSLRQVYESRLIGEQGLRRLIKIYNQGGDLQKALRQEIIEHELDYERDPKLRDKAFHAAPQKAASVTLDDLLVKAEAGVELSPKDAQLLKERTIEAQEQQIASQQWARKVADTAFIAIITFLLLIIVVLLLGRR